MSGGLRADKVSGVAGEAEIQVNRPDWQLTIGFGNGDPLSPGEWGKMAMTRLSSLAKGRPWGKAFLFIEMEEAVNEEPQNLQGLLTR